MHILMYFTHIYTQGMLQVLDSCHPHSDFWMVLLWLPVPLQSFVGVHGQCTEGCVRGVGV